MDTHISISAWAEVEYNWNGKNFPIMRIVSGNSAYLCKVDQAKRSLTNSGEIVVGLRFA